MGTRAKILICDDEEPLRELMRAALLGEYEFAEAATVGEAIEAADRVKPDAVLIDLMMPGGSGLDVLRHLRRTDELRDVRAVVISAFTADSDREGAFEAGADAFVAKPFDPDELSDTVSQLLATRR